MSACGVICHCRCWEQDEQQPAASTVDDGATPLYPDVFVSLLGQDSNAGAMVGRTADALRAARVPRDVIEQFRREAYSGSYANLIATIEKYVSTDSTGDES